MAYADRINNVDDITNTSKNTVKRRERSFSRRRIEILAQPDDRNRIIRFRE